MFYSHQSTTQKNKYFDYLQKMGAISNLFSQNNTPYLDYRIAENIFCLSFDAENLSRADVSIDAKKESIGIGLKTFLHLNGCTYQKIAEFNAISQEVKDLSIDETIKTIVQARNRRIQATTALYGIDKNIYHCVTRNVGVNYLFEFEMKEIDLDKIIIQKVDKKKNIINFTDGIYEYKFNPGKHTLFKRFMCDIPIETIDIDILNDPFTLFKTSTSISAILKNKPNPSIYLPLYAPSSNTNKPKPQSGLNQWNANGRDRDEDEIYIPIPSWIHKIFSDFFPPSNNINFNLILPNGEHLKAKTCQSGRKGLMSNPNKSLGKWLLRDVLRLPPGTLVTRNILDMANIDSARIEKVNNNTYKIDFMSIGQYEKFKRLHNG